MIKLCLPELVYFSAWNYKMTEAIQPLGRTTFGDPVNKGNVLSESEALKLLNDWVENEKLQLHMKQVAAVMKAWALER
ncbi:MAG: hypothetical protein ICV66_07145, partial [Chitinophagaceae bacterium]|nr:hypothetical protein [Chitinophagaceae bacterium]